MVAAAILAGGSLVASEPASGSRQEATLIACLQHSEFHYYSSPRTCSLFARQYYPNGLIRRYRDINGERLRWKHWGRSVAVGVGRDDFGLALTVFAFHRRRCPDGRYYYGKALTKRPVGHDQHLRLAHCGAKYFSPITGADFPQTK